jgi:hypothetical protein
VSSYNVWERELKSVLFTHVADALDGVEHDWYEDYAEGITPSEAVERFLRSEQGDKAQ